MASTYLRSPQFIDYLHCCSFSLQIPWVIADHECDTLEATIAPIGIIEVVSGEVMKRLSAPQSIRREKQTMNYPNRAIETDRTNVDIDLGRRATKAVFVSLLSLFFFFPISQNAAAQSAGFAFLEFTPFEQTEAAPGQYIILASHKVDGVCGSTRNNAKRHIRKLAKAVSPACDAAVGDARYLNVLCPLNSKSTQTQIDNAKVKAEFLADKCGCTNYCPHLPSP